MKMSEVSLDTLMALPDEQKWNICCSGVKDDGDSAEVALLLGSKPERAVERALAAAKLYRDGRVGTIIPSGGVKWDYQGECLSEAEIMARVLRENGVPDEAIVLENEARTTVENMICGMLQIYRKYKRFTDGIIIVTSVSHMKRSLALAKLILPQGIKASAYPSYPKRNRDEWLREEENQVHIRDSLRLLKEVVDKGEAEDMEIEL